MKKNRLILKHNRNRNLIEFQLQNGQLVGITNYREDIWKEFNTVNWYVNLNKYNNKEKAYVYTGSNKFAGKKELHVIVMIKWYGEQEVIEAHQNGYIVEHFDNAEANCLIENLAFVSNDLNLAKAHLYDKERLKYKYIVTVNFFKDFETKKYQATFGFNKEVIIQENDKQVNVSALRLVYPDDYRLVFQDLTSSMYQIISKGVLNLNLLSFEKKEVDSSYVIVPPGKDLPVIIEEDGKWLLVLSEKVRLDRIAPKLELYNDKEESKD